MRCPPWSKELQFEKWKCMDDCLFIPELICEITQRSALKWQMSFIKFESQLCFASVNTGGLYWKTCFLEYLHVEWMELLGSCTDFRFKLIIPKERLHFMRKGIVNLTSMSIMNSDTSFPPWISHQLSLNVLFVIVHCSVQSINSGRWQAEEQEPRLVR
jgi:hypothetical protein